MLSTLWLVFITVVTKSINWSIVKYFQSINRSIVKYFQ